ncbi:PREDICTED: olfactory receptor 12D3-like [Ceratotherium simum simum]|uniref:Olfactory receptor n=1 Tax=Ceratotherium simum simum TaxID=73337 RepID=A0ABM0I757_CERSS|nr:PREDICTED: olfactory receptor 12D3-like [Ceratotherium simum simum]
MENITTGNEFLLLELTSIQELQPILFTTFLILYMIDLFGNGFILVIVISEPRLHSPMYFFLGNLSCLDICYSSVTLPKLMSNLLSTNKAITFPGCITQLHFFHFMGGTEALLLTIMGFDRFVAICHPLRYTVIMNPQVCSLLAAGAWLTSFFYALMHSVMTARLNFCHSQKLPYFFCDVKPLLELACGDIRLNQWLIFTVTCSLAMASCFLTLLSYFYIIGFLLFQNRSCRVLHKALSTCASHFTVVSLYYGTVALIYIPPTSATSVVQERFVAVIHTTVTPVLNPLIYTLRNKEVKLALRRVFGRKLKLFP